MKKDVRREIKIAITVLFGMLFIGGLWFIISPLEVNQDQDPAAACVTLCQQSQLDLSAGPCLSNNLAPDYVCDVAHVPRNAMDNDPANQCASYGVTAMHFVEVTPDCEVVRVV